VAEAGKVKTGTVCLNLGKIGLGVGMDYYALKPSFILLCGFGFSAGFLAGKDDLSLSGVQSGSERLEKAEEAEKAEEGKKSSGVPRFDLLRARYESDEARGFNRFDGELEYREASIGGFLSKPIELGGDWRALPFAKYSVTDLDFDGVPAGLPLRDQELHELSLHAFLFHQNPDSRWTYGAWGRVRFASDTQDVNGDDFFYDFGIGSGYRVNDRLLVGLAFVGLEVGRDGLYVPGPMVMWRPNDAVSVAWMGPLLISTWRVSDDWSLALRGAPHGGIWNVASGGASQDYDLRSFLVRFHTEHRIKDNLWLSLGVGYTFGGNLEVRDSSGSRLFEDNLEGGLSFSVGLRLRSW